MRKQTIILATFACSAALSLGFLAAVGAPAPAPWETPRYRLDARYHGLPQQLVDDLLAHPPARAAGEPRIRCTTLTTDPFDEHGYCICFGADACSAAPDLGNGPKEWVCEGPLGAIDDNGTAVWRASPKPTVTITG